MILTDETVEKVKYLLPQ